MLQSTKETFSKLRPPSPKVRALYKHRTLKQSQININTSLLANLRIKLYSNLTICSTMTLFFGWGSTQEPMLTVFCGFSRRLP